MASRPANQPTGEETHPFAASPITCTHTHTHLVSSSLWVHLSVRSPTWALCTGQVGVRPPVLSRIIIYLLCCSLSRAAPCGLAHRAPGRKQFDFQTLHNPTQSTLASLNWKLPNQLVKIVNCLGGRANGKSRLLFYSRHWKRNGFHGLCLSE